MRHDPNRRQFLKGAAALAGASALGLLRPGRLLARGKNPTSPVSIARCKTYDPDDVLGRLKSMADQLGGLSKLVSGKTVAVKVNLTGNVKEQAVGLPAGRTYHVHPNMVLATATLLDRAGAKRIRFLEGTYQLAPMEEYLQGAGWDLKALAALTAKVEYEDTRNLGQGTRYTEVKVPGGGSLYPAYLLNHSYVDCDVYVSLAKLKNHATAGVTLSMKNNFGITPTALYARSTSTTRRVSRPASTSSTRARSGRPTACRRSSTPTARVGRRTGCRGTRWTRWASAPSTWRSSTASRRYPAARGRGCWS